MAVVVLPQLSPPVRRSPPRPAAAAASAIAAGFRQVQDQILRAFSDLANIRPAGQVDPLPFPCDQNPTLVQVLFQGDDILQRRLSADGDNNHQYLSIVRVVFQATEVLAVETTTGIIK